MIRLVVLSLVKVGVVGPDVKMINGVSLLCLM